MAAAGTRSFSTQLMHWSTSMRPANTRLGAHKHRQAQAHKHTAAAVAAGGANSQRCDHAYLRGETMHTQAAGGAYPEV